MGDTKVLSKLNESTNSNGDEANDSLNDHDPHYDPIITLPETEVKTLEEEESELIKMRAKLFRFDSSESPAEWKERGTGEAKLLWHKENKTVRMVMRRDKTLKICANHFVTPEMHLKVNCNSDRAWIWSVIADFADEVPKQELLAIRFASVENAQLWKEKFTHAQELVRITYEGQSDEDDDESAEGTEELLKKKNAAKDDSSALASDLKKLAVSEEKSEKSPEKKSPSKDSPGST